MKATQLRIFYTATLFVLTALFLPFLRELLALWRFFKGGGTPANESLLVPFASVSLALLVCFSLFPLLSRRRHGTLLACVLVCVVFIASSVTIETFTERQWDQLLSSDTGSIPNARPSGARPDPDALVLIQLGGEEIQAIGLDGDLTGAAYLTADGRRVYPASMIDRWEPMVVMSRMPRARWYDEHGTGIYSISSLPADAPVDARLQELVHTYYPDWYRADADAVQASPFQEYAQSGGVLLDALDQIPLLPFRPNTGDTLRLQIGDEQVWAVVVNHEASGVALITEDGRRVLPFDADPTVALTSRMMMPSFFVLGNDDTLIPVYYWYKDSEPTSNVDIGPYLEALEAEFPSSELSQTAQTVEPLMVRLHVIQPAVRIHYYIFSLILLVSVLWFLYRLGISLWQGLAYGEKRRLMVQGTATGCYTAAVLLVRVMQYTHYETATVTAASALSALLCIQLAAISVGLLASALLHSGKTERIVPPALAALTVTALYAAEYLMLGGRLYRYGDGPFFSALPLVPFSVANVLSVLLAAVLVLMLQRMIKVPVG